MNDTVAGTIWLLLGVVILAFAALFFLESFTYYTHQPPITRYVRNWTWGHVWLAALIGAGLIASASIMVTHFILDGGKADGT